MFPLEDGVFIRQDRENDEAEEQVDEDPCWDFDFLGASYSKFVELFEQVFDIFCLAFGLPPLKRELRKLASRPPGEIGCFTFFKSW